jgi:hypothetical protein
MTYTQSHLQCRTLTDKLWLNVFQYLNHIDLCCSTSRVCKLFHRLSRSDFLWRPLYLFHNDWSIRNKTYKPPILRPKSSFKQAFYCELMYRLTPCRYCTVTRIEQPPIHILLTYNIHSTSKLPSIDKWNTSSNQHKWFEVLCEYYSNKVMNLMNPKFMVKHRGQNSSDVVFVVINIEKYCSTLHIKINLGKMMAYSVMTSNCYAPIYASKFLSDLESAIYEQSHVLQLCGKGDLNRELRSTVQQLFSTHNDWYTRRKYEKVAHDFEGTDEELFPIHLDYDDLWTLNDA